MSEVDLKDIIIIEISLDNLKDNELVFHHNYLVDYKETCNSNLRNIYEHLNTANYQPVALANGDDEACKITEKISKELRKKYPKLRELVV